MKLIPEQIKLLRERKEALLKSRNNYLSYCNSRERTQMDGVGSGCVVDYQNEWEYYKDQKDLEEIEKILSGGEFVSDRNFEFIDIGTRFSVTFDDEFKDNDMLFVESFCPVHETSFAASESDFGRAVLGKKVGDKVTYTVQATGRELSLTIDEIDNIKEHYTHFIRENEYSNRISSAEKKELSRLMREDPEEYQRRQALTKSQVDLLQEELSKISPNSRDPKELSRKGIIKKLLGNPVVSAPEDDTIGVGSHVTITLTDENGELIEKSFEFVNQAVSTELESHYVERISPLGHAIYGLKKDDSFVVKRKHKASLKGIVDAVDNDYDNKARRVK